MRAAVLFTLVLFVLPAPTGAERSAVGAVTVRDAIAEAAGRRFGAKATVTVTELRTEVADTADLVAVPDPGARAGRAARFSLRAGGRYLGTAVARVRIETPHVRALSALARDTAIIAAQVEQVDGEVTGVRFEPLPGLDDIVGAQARRAVAPGEVLSHALVLVPDAVRAGDEVRVVARVGVLEAWGTGRTSASGRVGDVVRITRGETRGLLRALVLAPGVVQVLFQDTQEIR